MNERIKLLAEQAAKEHGHTIKFSSEITETLNSFAELIVAECISICKDKERPNLYGVREVEGAIKQHFGVEK